MIQLEIKYCPGTLAAGFNTYSKACLNRLFNGRKVNHILPYESPSTNDVHKDLYNANHKRNSISGVQEKFSIILDKNKLRLINEGERGTHILKPISTVNKNVDLMPANEHLTMQIARQVFNIETAENAIIFFKNGDSGYITKRFDIDNDGKKLAVEDFASLSGRTSQTHGEHYKYQGSYVELFELMKKRLPIYGIEAPKLFKLLLFNFLFSNGDAHFKNFSILETDHGDFRLSPAYDLLNTQMHINDSDFALDEGLLPKNKSVGKILNQFKTLSQEAGLQNAHTDKIISDMLSKNDQVKLMIGKSFLSESGKRNYLQTYQAKLKRMSKT